MLSLLEQNNLNKLLASRKTNLTKLHYAEIGPNFRGILSEIKEESNSKLQLEGIVTLADSVRTFWNLLNDYYLLKYFDVRIQKWEDFIALHPDLKSQKINTIKNLLKEDISTQENLFEPLLINIRNFLQHLKKEIHEDEVDIPSTMENIE